MPSESSKYCQQTMGMIRHNKPKPGFSGCPYNTPGEGEEGVAKVAYPDPQWKAEDKYKEHKKTPTGEAIANEIRDLRLRMVLTGAAHKPRLAKKTNHKAISASEEVDFEEEIAAYKAGRFKAPA